MQAAGPARKITYQMLAAKFHLFEIQGNEKSACLVLSPAYCWRIPNQNVLE